MKRLIIITLLFTALAACAAQTDDPIGIAVETYFTAVFAKLGEIAAQKPTAETFRDAVRPCVKTIDGFFDATLIDTDFVIIQTYFKRDAFVRGFSLRKVKPLETFLEQMEKNPAPQLSEPSHGSLFQPHLISMRYPVLKDGKLQSVVSMMVRTEKLIETAGLDKCRAYKIICRGELAEEKGNLSADHHEVKLTLPSTEWVIQYDF